MTTIPLSRPLSHDDQTLTSVEVDEPSIGAIEAFEVAKSAGKSDLTATIEMLAFDLELPVSVVRRIRASDMEKINEAMAPFVQDNASLGVSGAGSSPKSPTS